MNAIITKTSEKVGLSPGALVHIGEKSEENVVITLFDFDGQLLRDVYNHIIHVSDSVENFRELASNLLDTYLSSISNKMNEVMKVLTIMASIFIPLTFFTSIYSMNFQHRLSMTPGESCSV